MLHYLIEIQRGLKNNTLKMPNIKLNKIIKDYTFLQFSEDFDFCINEQYYQNINESSVIVIDHYKYSYANDHYIIFGFKKTIIIMKVDQLSSEILSKLLHTNQEKAICFLNDTKLFISQRKPNLFDEYKELPINENFLDEINSFNDEFLLNSLTQSSLIETWKSVQSCISGFLIQQGYFKLNSNRIENFVSSFNEINLGKDDFIELRNLGIGSSFLTTLIYHIEKEELFVIKKPNGNVNESPKLINRELENYKKIPNHPFLPKYIGKTDDNNYLVIEFINGKTLINNKFNENEKITIIFQLMIIVQYLHYNKFIYRDLKPDNIMIDSNKTVVLIDLDRMISSDCLSNNQIQIHDFGSSFTAPEVSNDSFSFECDIYSIGKMIYYLMKEKIPSNDKVDEFELTDEYKIIQKLYYNCLKKNPKERPNISELVFEIYVNYHSKIKIDNLFFIFKDYFAEVYNEILMEAFNNLNINDPKAQYTIAQYYVNEKFVPFQFEQMIHFYELSADQNYPNANYNLGLLYKIGFNVEKDINKSIQYFKRASDCGFVKAQYELGYIYEEIDMEKAIYFYELAAKNNDEESLFLLGVIYESGEFVSRDIDKAIYYYSLAADKNYVKAQYNLGFLYHNSKYIEVDINKAIHYYKMAADQNFDKAQYNLGMIYLKGEYVAFDISKAIKYFTLAADQNNIRAQFHLGLIYYKGDHVMIDMKKAIHYLTLAANQNDSDSQYNLGVIYLLNNYVKHDIEKAIHYFTLSAEQNNIHSQYNLGLMYDDGKFIPRNVDKAIYYYSLAAKQNDAAAQNNLGHIYSKCKMINKAIYYYSLSAKQNDPSAQYNLGCIYYSGNSVPKDINKAIYYFSLAADQNYDKAQYNLGLIYQSGIDVQRDINKAIKFFKLAAKQNHIKAQFNLGCIYYFNELVPRDINKALYYFTLAAYHNLPNAQFNLGVIYLKGIYVMKDINKGILYIKLAANQGITEAQYLLGLLYYCGHSIQKNENIGIMYLTLSSENKSISACFFLGFLYHEGKCKYTKRDIKKSIRYYKESSSFYNQYAKNNLGILYKNGFGDEVPKNIDAAIIFFEEAIRFKKDIVAMYNLAHIYLYEKFDKDTTEESIKLSIQSLKKGFEPSKFLLYLALIKKYGINFNMKQIIKKYDGVSSKIVRSLLDIQLTKMPDFEFVYQRFKSIDFLYNCVKQVVPSQSILDDNYDQKILNEKIKDISSEFYEGYGLSI